MRETNPVNLLLNYAIFSLLRDLDSYITLDGHPMPEPQSVNSFGASVIADVCGNMGFRFPLALRLGGDFEYLILAIWE